MALVKCGECGNDVIEAAACPKCGTRRPLKKRRDLISTVAPWFVPILVIILIGIGLFPGVLREQTVEQAKQDSAAAALLSKSDNCRVSDISIARIGNYSDESSFTVTGRILNRCSMPTGVQLKITLYDGSGAVLSVEDFWPASTNNIPANTDFPFEWLFPGTTGIAKYDVRVIEVKSWAS